MINKKVEESITTDTFRTEKDSIGAKNVPEDVYYGVQTLRAAENFQITGLSMHPEIINSLAYIKKAAADIAKEALKSGESVRNLILKKGLMSEEDLDNILDPVHMTKPGISGKELLKKSVTVQI